MKSIITALAILISNQSYAGSGVPVGDFEEFSGNYYCESGCPLPYQQQMVVSVDLESHSIKMNWIQDGQKVSAFGGGFENIDQGPQLDQDTFQYKTYFQSRSSKSFSTIIVESETRVCTVENDCEPKWRLLEHAEFTKNGTIRLVRYGAVYKKLN
jgi:hypothetical protein